MSVAGTNVRKTSELIKAARHVVAKRMTLGAAAMIDPFNTDHVEFAKIIPEKTRAFSEAGITWLQRSGQAAELMARFAASELATIAQAAVDMAGCRTPADLISRQSSFAPPGFLGRSRNPLRWAPSLCDRRAPLWPLCTEPRRQMNAG